MSLESKTDLDWKEVGMNSYLGPGEGRVGARAELGHSQHQGPRPGCPRTPRPGSPRLPQGWPPGGLGDHSSQAQDLEDAATLLWWRLGGGGASSAPCLRPIAAVHQLDGNKGLEPGWLGMHSEVWEGCAPPGGGCASWSFPVVRGHPYFRPCISSISGANQA